MPANAIPPLTPPRVIRLLVIHCLDTPNGRPIGVDDVARMHQERGHDGIQFHYLIDLAGVVHFCRSPERIGRHTRGWNVDSLGIALVGRNKYTRYQWAALAELVSALAVQYQIPQEVPDFLEGRVSGVAGSCDVPNAHTTSPGFDVRTWLAAGMQSEHHLPWRLPEGDHAAILSATAMLGRWQWSES